MGLILAVRLVEKKSNLMLCQFEVRNISHGVASSGNSVCLSLIATDVLLCNWTEQSPLETYMLSASQEIPQIL